MKPRNDGGDPSNSFLFPGVDPSPEKECNWLRKDLIAARKAIGELHDKNDTLRADNERLREALRTIQKASDAVIEAAGLRGEDDDTREASEMLDDGGFAEDTVLEINSTARAALAGGGE